MTLMKSFALLFGLFLTALAAQNDVIPETCSTPLPDGSCQEETDEKNSLLQTQKQAGEDLSDEEAEGIRRLIRIGLAHLKKDREAFDKMKNHGVKYLKKKSDGLDLAGLKKNGKRGVAVLKGLKDKFDGLKAGEKRLRDDVGETLQRLKSLAAKVKDKDTLSIVEKTKQGFGQAEKGMKAGLDLVKKSVHEKALAAIEENHDLAEGLMQLAIEEEQEELLQTQKQATMDLSDEEAELKTLSFDELEERGLSVGLTKEGFDGAKEALIDLILSKEEAAGRSGKGGGGRSRSGGLSQGVKDAGWEIGVDAVSGVVTEAATNAWNWVTSWR